MTTPFGIIVSTGGTSGPAGTGWRSGIGPPTSAIGQDGDFYLDTTNTSAFYGPKAGGAWPPTPTPFTILKSNLTAVTNPTNVNDSSQGYVLGSFWINTLTGIYFVASQVSLGAAIWTPVLAVGTGSNTVAAGNDPRITGALQSLSNLADLTNTSNARTNLGLGNSATLNVGTNIGSVAAGNDSRIVNALQSTNNLSDLGSAASARTNLGLGSAATENVGTTNGTVASGNDSRITGAIQTGTAAGGDLGGTLPASVTVVATHLSAPLPLIQGGTGSTTQNFVDLTTGQSIGGTKTFTGEVIVPTPVNGTDAATKQYADSIASGVAAKASVVAASTAALPANTYNNGSSGVGATLTGNAVGTLVVDGHSVSSGERILVKNEATQANNGIYTCTTQGSVSVAYVLTRATDMNTPSQVVSAFTFVTAGTVNTNTGWIVTGTGPYVIGTTAIVFTQFSGAGSITAGTGLTQSGSTISLIVPVAAGNLPSATTSAFGIVEIDGTATDIQALGTQAAGATGKVADAGHVHPTTGVVTTSTAATSVALGTSYGTASAVGVDLTYAREDHQHGTVSLTTLAPSAIEAIGTAAVLGTATTPAKADHVHPMAAAATPTTSAVGDSAATGLATTFAASNHVHGREAFAAPASATTYGLTAVTGSAATVSHSDHTHGTPSLTTIAPSATEAIGTAAVLGTATTPALADHVHPMASAAVPTTSAVGDLAATGAATTFAASNHVHGREAFGAVTALSSFGTSAANGTSTSVSRTDHVHGAPSLPLAAVGSPGIVQLTGDLGGTSSAPSVLKINGVTVSGTPVANQAVVANSATAAAWQIQPGLFAPTGILTGGIMSIASATTFNITAATGYITDYTTTPSSPTITKVPISAQTVTVPTSPQIRWWVSDINGNITSLTAQPTPDQRRTSIQLGLTTIPGGVLNNAISAPVYAPQETNQLYDFMYALGPFNASGNTIGPNGANLRFNFTSGQFFSVAENYSVDPNNPHNITTVTETPASFFQATQVAGSETVATLIDPTHYDVGGTVTLVPGGASTTTIQRVYLFGSRSAGNQLLVQYGQATYGSLATAKTNIGIEPFVADPNTANGGLLVGWIVISKSCASLADTTTCSFVQAPKFASP